MVYRYHVVEGLVLWSKDLRMGHLELPTIFGSKLKVTVNDGDIFVNDGMVIGEDIITTHGVIHIVERYSLRKFDSDCLIRGADNTQQNA